MKSDNTYIVVRGDRYDCPDQIERYVNEKIQKGYKPIGGVVSFVKHNEVYFAQAMIKECKQEGKE